MDIRPVGLGQTKNLLERIPLGSFLQSDAWAEFQESYGRTVLRFGAYDDSTLLGSLTLIEHQLLLDRSYYYVPHGPLTDHPVAMKALLQAAIEAGQQGNAMFLKVDLPISPFELAPVLPDAFNPGTALQPRHTQVMNIQQSDELLLAQMHQKSRYNLRLAQKKGVTIRWSTSDEDFATFLLLQHQTMIRQHIHLPPDRYYQLMFETLRRHQMIELGIAEFEGRPIAINEIIWCGTTATYIHGASSDINKEVMAPYLLQWATMQRARERGMHQYDLRGIAPADQPNHKLAGVTRFKLGLGGTTVVYPEAQNAILQPMWYWAYRFAKRIRRGIAD